jgi:hypothetical protein
MRQPPTRPAVTRQHPQPQIRKLLRKRRPNRRSPTDPIDELPSSGFWAESALALETAAALETVHANPVWVPFHSQMSAEGFATRLSQSLGREFRVERQGAGAYQVVFDETDPIERDQVLDRVSEVTGQ